MPRYITEKGIRGRYYSRLEQYMGTSWIDKLSVKFDSDEEVEDYAWLGTPPGLSEKKGERHVEAAREFFYQLRNKDYDGGLKIPRKLIERDKTGQVDMLIEDFAERGGSHWIELLSALILAGTGDSLGKCYDGQYYFDIDHSEGSSGTQLNLLAAGQVAKLGVTTPTAPTATEAIDAILGVIAYMLTYKDDHGKPMNSGAREFLVMTAPVLWSYLTKAIFGNTDSAAASNIIKELEKDGFRVSLAANPLLTYTTQFLTFRTDAPLKPLIRQDEIDVDIEILGQESDHWKKEHEMLVMAYARRAVGFGRWQYASHSTFS